MAKMCEYYKVNISNVINYTYLLQDYLDFIIFPEEVVLGDPVEKWPVSISY